MKGSAIMGPLLRAASVLLVGLAGVPAEAQLNRSAVSVAGDDANPCTPAAPCRTFDRAISQTNTGGEVVALTSGGYGPFTVNRPMTVQAAPGIYAGVTAAAGTGIAVATSNGLVLLRGLTVEGLGTGEWGIQHTFNVGGSGGELYVENCVVDGFRYGVASVFGLTVKDSVVRQYRTVGLWIVNATARGTVDGLRLTADGTSSGVLGQDGGRGTVRDVVLTNRGRQGLGLGAISGSVLNAENVAVSGFSSGVLADSNAILRVSNTVATENRGGLRNDHWNGSVMEIWGNNKSQGNQFNIEGNLTTVPQL
jgi:hypothetical protein